MQDSKHARRPSVGLLQNLLCLGDKDEQPPRTTSDVTKPPSAPAAGLVTLFQELCSSVTLLSKYTNQMAVSTLFISRHSAVTRRFK
jgi:hypothetical protein